MNRSVLLPATLLVLAGFVGAASGADPAGAIALVVHGDSLRTEGGLLRGLAWLDDGERVALVVAQPDIAGKTDAATADTAAFDPTAVVPDLEPPPRWARLVWLNAAGRVLRSWDVDGVLSRGLAWDGEFLWGVGDAGRDGEATLCKIKVDTLRVEETYPTPGHHPSDLTWDGRSVWMVDRDRGRLDRFDPDTEEVTRSLPTPGFSPCGIASDGSSFWITDYGTGRLDRVSRGGSRVIGTAALDIYGDRGRDVGLAWDGARLWALPRDGGEAWVIGVH